MESRNWLRILLFLLLRSPRSVVFNHRRFSTRRDALLSLAPSQSSLLDAPDSELSNSMILS